MLVSRHRRRLATGMCAVLAAALLGSCTGDSDGKDTDASESPDAAGKSRPNIVFVLTDDLSENLVPYMPHVREMAEKGVSFPNYYVTDSLCCPSRSTIFTGDYPHNTGVFTNNGDDGGYGAFTKNGGEEKCFADSLRKAGYRTGFMGKYMNGYTPDGEQRRPERGGGRGRGGEGARQADPAAAGGEDATDAGTAVPPGWDEWDVAGDGYKQYDYDLNENGKVTHYGSDPEDYLTDVLSDRATSFVDDSVKAEKPFMLEVSTFSPHGPATPAPRDEDTYPTVEAPRTAAYDKAPTPAPEWQKGLKPLSAQEKKEIDRKFAKRVRSVQAVDDLVGRVQKQLAEKGIADETYFVFSSDNGFHMGEHRLRPGKQTAYDTDINVPLMVTGPGVSAGEKVPQIAENTDLSPTFQELAGLEPPSDTDGRSLAPLLHGEQPDDWREAALVEHHRGGSRRGDPDAAPENAGNPPDYAAIRTDKELYVEYADGQREFYRTDSDPDQLRNRADELSADERASLHGTLTALTECEGAKECTEASRRDE